MTTQGVPLRRVAVSLSPMKYRPPDAPPPTGNNSVRQGTNNGNNAQQQQQQPHCSVAMNDTETVLVSASGDVLVCRCRESSTPYLRGGEMVSRRTKASLRHWWEPDCDALTNHIGDAVLASPCCGNQRPSSARSLKMGLRGGGGSGTAAAADESPPRNERQTRKYSSESLEEKKNEDEPTTGDDDESNQREKTRRTKAPTSSLLDVENATLFPLPSFDYSHFADDGNDMIPSSQQRLDSSRKSGQLETVPEHRESYPDNSSRDKQFHHQREVESATSPMHSGANSVVESWDDTLTTPDFFHGVPVFHPAFAQIRIKQVSANPFGSHVLLISREALLFAYGLNNHGQLGNGQKAKSSGSNRGFIATPVLVTPLLENGGKALMCAAGKSHSLVVVRTEGRRVGRLRQRNDEGSKDSSSDVSYEITRRVSSGSQLLRDPKNVNNDGNDSLMHHQLYGFGNNKYMKLGLLNPGKKYTNDQEDVLLPRRVALHCNVWPDNAGDGGSMPPYGIFEIAASCDHSAALVRRATGDIELYTWGNGTHGALGLAGSQMRFTTSESKLSSRPEASKKTATNTLKNKARGDLSPHSKAIAPIPSLVTSMSFIPGRDSESPFLHPSEFPTSVALGNTCSFLVTSKGRCLSLGSSETGMLGLGPGLTKTVEPVVISFPSGSSRTTTHIKSVSAGARHVVARSAEGSAFAWGNTSYKDSHDNHSDEFGAIAWQPERVQIPSKRIHSKPHLLPTPDAKSRVKVAHACAGPDTTVLVTDSGEVLSYGKMSGQLGLGELRSDVLVPTPMLGGLRLWRCQDKQSTVNHETAHYMSAAAAAAAIDLVDSTNLPKSKPAKTISL